MQFEAESAGRPRVHKRRSSGSREIRSDLKANDLLMRATNLEILAPEFAPDRREDMLQWPGVIETM